jgi:5'(3')-deoxyribonucleotidase
MIDVVLIDMDGVLADFARHALAKFDRSDVYDSWPSGKYEIHEIIDMPQDEFWAELDKEGPEFWSSMPALPWALQLCEVVRDMVGTFYIATSPSRAPASSMGKVHWLQNFFDPRFRRYMLGSHKHLMAKPGVVLIDDSDEKCTNFIEAGGDAILFPQPWNSNHDQIYPEANRSGLRLDFVIKRLDVISNRNLCV